MLLGCSHIVTSVGSYQCTIQNSSCVVIIDFLANLFDDTKCFIYLRDNAFVNVVPRLEANTVKNNSLLSVCEEALGSITDPRNNNP
jgi:hypothetical protein